MSSITTNQIEFRNQVSKEKTEMNRVVIVLVAAFTLTYGQLNLDPSDPNYLNQCGHRSLYKPNNGGSDPTKVVGGNASVVGDHPWQVALFRNNVFICGGAILDQYTIVTAAHCTTLTE